MKSNQHLVYLNLGSNIHPESNLVRAVELLHKYGEVMQVSSAWESKSFGAQGPNYLNACVLFETKITQTSLKESVVRPIESQLGRKRSDNKYTPRPIDIDIILFDNKPYNDKIWKLAFVIIPLAEIYPEFNNPISQENIVVAAKRLRSEVWMEARPEVLSQFMGNNYKGQN